MAKNFNTLHKNVTNHDSLSNQKLFHCKIFLIALFCSLVGSTYAQTDYAELEWVRTYIGSDSTDSVSKGMALDKEGNIYIAIDNIASTDSGFNFDYVLVKYDDDGNEKWLAHYAASKNINTIEDMVGDKQGNIYIAGSADLSTKYVVLKYNHSGALRWTNTSDADNPPLSFAINLLP